MLYRPRTDVTPGILWHNPRVKGQECHGITSSSILNKALYSPAWHIRAAKQFPELQGASDGVLRKPWQGLSVHDTTHTLSSLESQPGQTLHPQVPGECPSTVSSQASTHLSLTHTGNVSTLRLTKLPLPGRKLSHKHSVIVCPLAGWSLQGFHNKEASLEETQTKQKKKKTLKQRHSGSMRASDSVQWAEAFSQEEFNFRGRFTCLNEGHYDVTVNMTVRKQGETSQLRPKAHQAPAFVSSHKERSGCDWISSRCLDKVQKSKAPTGTWRQTQRSRDTLLYCWAPRATGEQRTSAYRDWICFVCFLHLITFPLCRERAQTWWIYKLHENMDKKKILVRGQATDASFWFLCTGL